jgi:RNA polymerase sigma factor (sigma-70 family)
MNRVLRHIRRAALQNVRDGPTDADLLESFLTRHDELAFETLLRRHGPMVLAVCRRVLRHAQDAEDAFQATFLVLVRRAGSLRSRELLANWLYGVALRTALSARAMGAKRRAKERQAGETPRPEGPEEGPSEELLARLDTALSRLPEKYRVPIVLCELGGRSRKEVARQLHIPEGTLSSRIAYAKKLLARRLARYAPGVVSAALARDAARACVPNSLLHATAQAALHVVSGQSPTAGVVSAQVVALTEGVIKTMLLSKIKGFTAVAFVLLVGVGAFGLAYRPAAAQQPVAGGGRPVPRVVADELEELRLEVAALRKGLQATRERVRALEEEVQTLKARPGTPLPPVRAGENGPGFSLQPFIELEGAPGNWVAPATQGERRPARRLEDPTAAGPQPKLPGPGTGGAPPGNKLEPPTPRGGGRPPDPLADAEAALKKLRQHPDDKQAVDALERALKALRDKQATDVRGQALKALIDVYRQELDAKPQKK